MSSRKRISQACKPCGAKKIKCDGGTPICGPCERKHDECSYGVSRRGQFARRLNNDSRPLSASAISLPRVPSAPNTIVQTTQQDPGKQLRENEDDQILIAPKATTQKGIVNGAAIAFGSEASKRLFQTYFDCIHPLWPILYKPMYTSFDYVYPSPSIPNVLSMAIFAIASCVGTQLSKQLEGASPQLYFEEALDLLQQNDGSDPKKPKYMFKPSIEHCQALTILSLQQHGLAEYSRAAIFCGLAASMAIELRLHRPYESNDPIQREIRYRLWWNVFILEKMISCEMGRPVMLRAEETDTPFPSTSEADEFELFSTTIKAPSGSDSIHVSGKMRTLSVLETTIQLVMIMERISREVYGLVNRKTLRNDPTIGEAKRLELWSVLQKWERDIGTSSLSLDLSEKLTSVPGVITNYIIMYSGTILLHRPFIDRWSSNPSSADPSVDPRRVCLDAAHNICTILEKYFGMLHGLPCDIVFSIFTAASTLLYHEKKCDVSDKIETQNRLRMCINWLSVLGQNWKTAGARQQLLIEMSATPSDENMVSQLATSSGQDPRPANVSFEPTTGQQLMADTTSNLANSGSRTEDWKFLRDFGDPSDEFYILDEELRGMLDDPQWKL